MLFWACDFQYLKPWLQNRKSDFLKQIWFHMATPSLIFMPKQPSRIRPREGEATWKVFSDPKSLEGNLSWHIILKQATAALLQPLKPVSHLRKSYNTKMAFWWSCVIIFAVFCLYRNIPTHKSLQLFSNKNQFLCVQEISCFDIYHEIKR